MNLEVITFQNVDSEDFDGMWGGKITTIKTGATVPLPKFLAEHYCKHLTDKILGENRGKTEMRDELKARILGSVQAVQQVQATVGAPKEPEFVDVVAPESIPPVVPEETLKYVCPTCKKSFAKQIAMRGHMRSHLTK